MTMDFKKYFEDLSTSLGAPTVTYHGPATREPTRPDDSQVIDDLNTGLHRPTLSPGTQAKSPVTPLSGFFNALRLIDPWLHGRRGPGYFGGTIDYMPPEVVKGDRNFDADSLTDLYNTLSRTRPDAAALLKPLLPAFTAFHQAAVKLYNTARAGGLIEESTELAYRLDAKRATDLTRGVERLKQAVAVVRTQDLGPVNALAKQAVAAFDRFHQQFQQVFPRVQQHLQQAHTQVAGQAWDQTG